MDGLVDRRDRLERIHKDSTSNLFQFVASRFGIPVFELDELSLSLPLALSEFLILRLDVAVSPCELSSPRKPR